MNAKEAWKQWLDALNREAAEIDAAGDALASITLETSPLIDVGPAGREALDRAMSAISKRSTDSLAIIRGEAARRRDFAAVAKWLGEPKRAAVLRVVAERTRNDQVTAARREGIPRSTQRAAEDRGLFRSWNGDEPQRCARIDRIIEGARLYAAAKA